MGKIAMAPVFVAIIASLPLFGQTFNSGSTGADGALNLASLNCETGPYAPLSGQEAGCWIQLPASGILNYTTIIVPLNKTLYFRKNLQNMPVVILAQGDVVVEGTISVDATAWLSEDHWDTTLPGPGGFPGGARPHGTGLGPGGGTTDSPPGHWVGPLSLVPIVGGSGGAATQDLWGGIYDGGGGGGAIVIASSGEVRIAASGMITASSNPICAYGVSPGHGSGGAVRLVANRIIQGGLLRTLKGGCTYTNPSIPGIVRLEAPTGSISYTGSSVPEPIITTINPAIVATEVPEFRIVSVGGFLVPDLAGTRKDAADLVLPKQLPDPINVVVEASKIPPGSPVIVSFGTSNQGTASAVPLAGSLTHSTATIGVSGLNRDQLAYLYVQVLFTLPPSSDGGTDTPESEHVAQVRMTIAPGAKPRFVFLRQDGAEVPADKLPAYLQAWISNMYLR